MNGFVLFRLEMLVATSVVSGIVSCSPSPCGSRRFVIPAGWGIPKFRGKGEGIWQTIGSWAVYALFLLYSTVRTFRLWVALCFLLCLCATKG